MESTQVCPPLADFFYHIVGDKSTYSQDLQDLYVCYTLTRGLQIESTSPRRPALPLELILCITRFAGYVSVNPDPALTLETSMIHCADPHMFCGGYTTPPFSRTHFASMARTRLSYDPPLFPGFPVSTSTDYLIFVPTRLDRNTNTTRTGTKLRAKTYSFFAHASQTVAASRTTPFPESETYSLRTTRSSNG